jgi:serine/threonine protein kinase
VKLTSLFDQAIDLNTGQRNAFLADLEARDRSVAQALKRLLEAEKSPLLPEPNVVSLRNIASEISAVSAKTVGGFQLIRPIGRGGMGEVWLATRSAGAATQQVALKILRFDIGNADAKLRFQLEQKMIASMNHPYVARMIDANHGAGELPWIAMEYVDGMNLSDWCKQNQLSVRARIELALKILEAVGHAHQHLIVHRDLKSSNVMVTKEGVPKLLDFGIAKRMGDTQKTATAQRFFSVGSVAPEQYSGDRTTVATDIYQMGLLLYELLAGVPAYDLEGLAPSQIQECILHKAPVPPSFVCTEEHARYCALEKRSQLQKMLAGELDRIVMYALRKNPPERYTSSGDFARDLQAFLDGRPVMASGQSVWYQARKFLTRHWLPSSLAGLAVVALFALMLQLLLRDAALTKARDVANKERDKAQNLNTFLIDLFRSASPTASNKKDVASIVLDAIDLQIKRKEFVTDPSAAFALIKAALGLGELAQGKRFLDIVGHYRAQYSPDEKRQLLLLEANIANIGADFSRLRAINSELAKDIHLGNAQQQTIFIGYVGQTLIGTDPERVLRITNLNPLPAPLIRLRARAFAGLKMYQAAADILQDARSRSDLTAMERISLLQSLTLAHLALRQNEKALDVSEEMIRSAGAKLGEQNSRLLPFWSTRAEALARNAKWTAAIEIYDDLLRWHDMSQKQQFSIRMNRLLLATNQSAIDPASRQLARELWAERDKHNSFIAAFAQLAMTRVLCFEGQHRQARDLLELKIATTSLDEQTVTELQIWREALSATVPNTSARLWRKKLDSVGSRDTQLRLIVNRIVTNGSLSRNHE